MYVSGARHVPQCVEMAVFRLALERWGRPVWEGKFHSCNTLEAQDRKSGIAAET